MADIKFNEAQQQVIDTTEGTVLVISCPGSGKTTVLIHRIKKLLRNGVKPNRILVTTFTVAAATDMTARLRKMGIDFKVSTIHSIAYRIAKTNDSSISIIPEEAVNIFFSNYIKKHYPDTLGKSKELDNIAKEMINLISYAKNTDADPEDADPMRCKKEEYLACYRAYEYEKKRAGKVDFDDCLIIARNLLRDDARTLSMWQEMFDYIMVDEYQDTNRIQAQIFMMLAEKHRNLCVVGDDDQAMYSFRGADSGIMLEFPQIMTPCTQIVMDTNYRSRPDIVKRADYLIKNNKNRFDKKLKSNRRGKADIDKIEVNDTFVQAKKIMGRIKKRKEEGVPYEDMAVLYRTNAESTSIVLELMRNGIPYHTNDTIRDPHSTVMFGDIKRYYKIACGRGDSADFIIVSNRPNRYLSRNVFVNAKCNMESHLAACKFARSVKNAESQITSFWNTISLLRKAENPEQFMQVFEKQMHYSECLRNVAQFTNQDPQVLEIQYSFLIDEAMKFSTMEEWFHEAENIKVELSAQKKKLKKTGVCLSTYHQAKGLEWDTVFLPDCIIGLTPHVNAQTEEELEEERRMFYVAFTRAKNAVYLYVPDIYSGNDAFPTPYLEEMKIDQLLKSREKSLKKAEQEEKLYNDSILEDIIYLQNYYENQHVITSQEYENIETLYSIIESKQVI